MTTIVICVHSIPDLLWRINFVLNSYISRLILLVLLRIVKLDCSVIVTVNCILFFSFGVCYHSLAKLHNKSMVLHGL